MNMVKEYTKKIERKNYNKTNVWERHVLFSHAVCHRQRKSGFTFLKYTKSVYTNLLVVSSRLQLTREG